MGLKKGSREELINQTSQERIMESVCFSPYGLSHTKPNWPFFIKPVQIHQEEEGWVRDKSAYPGGLLQVRGLDEKKDDIGGNTFVLDKYKIWPNTTPYESSMDSQITIGGSQGII